MSLLKEGLHGVGETQGPMQAGLIPVYELTPQVPCLWIFMPQEHVSPDLSGLRLVQPHAGQSVVFPSLPCNWGSWWW